MVEFDAILIADYDVVVGWPVRGTIHHDSKGRFTNGTYIVTGKVKSYESDVAVTESGTRYLIIQM